MADRILTDEELSLLEAKAELEAAQAASDAAELAKADACTTATAARAALEAAKDHFRRMTGSEP